MSPRSTLDAGTADAELKARHRTMWASGDYPSMVETFLLPLGPRLVEACGIGAGQRVLDVAAGTGNASIPAAQRGAERRPRATSRPSCSTPAASAREAAGVELDWVEADAEHLPFDDASFDVVMSVDRRDVRAPPPGRGRRARARLPPRRDDRAAELDARGHDRRAVPHDGPVRAAAARPAPSRRRCGAARSTSRELFGDRVDVRDAASATILEVTAFAQPARLRASTSRRATARRSSPGRTPRKDGREAEFDAALDALLRRVGPRHARPRPLRDGVPARGRDEGVVGQAPTQQRQSL